MVVDIVAIVVAVLALIPVLLYVINVRLYRPAPAPSGPRPSTSILIPARNEERSIGSAVKAALASHDVDFEVVVLDDHSDDRTAAIVADFAARDARVRLVASESLPDGWCGKQFACEQLARHARFPLLVFADADVRLAPDAVARLASFLESSRADLVSGIPRQETGTWPEKLVIPLAHFLLLGYLPFFFMRRFRHPAFAAGCGQLFVTRREAYEAVGGHATIRGSRHDGLTLPRAYRRAGRMTDLCDVTDLASCRMYESARELWFGLAKNAREGLASPRAIAVWTILLLGGQVLPFVLIAWLPWMAAPALSVLLVRLDAARRFRQSWFGAVLHPISVIVLLAIQWYATTCAWTRRPIGWKGRT
jgi:cellulose synthase/poly-beta-1,6-N-acetylglucosamine synthase-like glycosyltransferase